MSLTLTPFAHRGLALVHTENTFEAFKAAQETGAQWLETDVNATADGVVLVFHDSTLNRVAGVGGKVAETSYAQIQELTLPGGEKIPTLLEALNSFPDLGFNIDLKDEASARSIGKILALTSHSLATVRLTSFSEKNLRLARQAVAEAGLSEEPCWGASEQTLILFYLLAHSLPALWPLLAMIFKKSWGACDALQIPETYRILGGKVPVLTRRLLEKAHRFGLRVDVWTIDKPADMRRLMNLGVDGIVSNRVDLLVELVRG